MWPSASREFLLNPLSSTQERRPNEASHEPQETERMGGTPAFQDGGHGNPKRVTEGERLDGPQRCILHDSNTPHASTVSAVCGKSTTLPVCMPPIQTLLCPMGIHQGDETHINFPSGHGGTYDSLHRRHTTDGGITRAGAGPPGSFDLSFDRSGVCYQHTQVSHNPNSTNQVGCGLYLRILY